MWNTRSGSAKVTKISGKNTKDNKEKGETIYAQWSRRRHPNIGIKAGCTKRIIMGLKYIIR